MSQTRQGAANGSNRARRLAAQQEAARRRRWGWMGVSAAVVVIVGLVLGLHIAASSSSSQGPGLAGSSSPSAPVVGQVAPNEPFTTLSGATQTVASLRGRPTLLWLMTTWCSSCQAGTQAMSENLAKLEADGVHVVQVENYDDLGQAGPSLTEFGKVLAGSNFTNPDWTFGEASAALTRAYNPEADLDIYYLLNAKGQVTFINSSPASTMAQLLSAAKRLA